MKPKTDKNAHAFLNPPRSVVGDWLPGRDDIPKEFRYGHPWCELAEHFFFNGQSGELVPFEGIDPGAALKHIQICLMSREPSHNHKIAGVGWLLSQWFKGYRPGDGEDESISIDPEE